MVRQDIADHLGLTIDTESSTLTRLDRSKVIVNVPGGVRLLNMAQLEHLGDDTPDGPPGTGAPALGAVALI